jgi:cytosine/adenosine deaminase-related metal-dependent hydrolase
LFNSVFYNLFRQQVISHGGFYNAHLHLDRAYSLDNGDVGHSRIDVLKNSYISLQKKHSLIASIHEGPTYDEENLRTNLQAVTEDLIKAGTRIADTMIDVCADRVRLNALNIINDYSNTIKDKITIRTAAYTPFGFNDNAPEMWEVFEEGVKKSDFIGSLPEADDIENYPDHIGYEEHCIRMLDLARREGKMLHVHTDQRNEPGENGTERLIEVIRREGGVPSADNQSMIWVVHMISPSTYNEERFSRLIDSLLETRIGVICCPSAALGMRQLRSIHTPTYNSIPRLLELAAAGVPVRLGSDNIGDICSPSTTVDLTDEIFILSAALRFYDIRILAKFACGVALNNDDREIISEHLRCNDEEIQKFFLKSKHSKQL